MEATDARLPLPGGRPEAVQALRDVIEQLDRAFAAIQHLRPHQANRWREHSRRTFSQTALELERGKGPNLEIIWDVVGDLRRLAQEARSIAENEGRPVTW